MIRMTYFVHVDLVDADIGLVLKKVFAENLVWIDVFFEKLFVGNTAVFVCLDFFLFEKAFVLQL